jgi:hypothetical protein
MRSGHEPSGSLSALRPLEPLFRTKMILSEKKICVNGANFMALPLAEVLENFFGKLRNITNTQTIVETEWHEKSHK